MIFTSKYIKNTLIINNIISKIKNNYYKESYGKHKIKNYEF